jgi:hypothetical protein
MAELTDNEVKELMKQTWLQEDWGDDPPDPEEEDSRAMFRAWYKYEELLKAEDASVTSIKPGSWYLLQQNFTDNPLGFWLTLGKG